ncbi:hypothetical protein LZ31DRAFT_561120 [Colletotrichum somersetense]|nr:hypothetical protein LZ31DRAFT_561120 [Colletotrichum somersetense]
MDAWLQKPATPCFSWWLHTQLCLPANSGFNTTLTPHVTSSCVCYTHKLAPVPILSRPGPNLSVPFLGAWGEYARQASALLPLL